MDYISITDFAVRANITRQAVYKQVNNPNSQLFPYVKKEGKHIFIAVRALAEVYKVDCNKSTQKMTTSKPEKPLEIQEEEERGCQSTNDNLTTDFVNHLKTQIEALTAEKSQMEERYNAIIQEKDRLIAEQALQMAKLAQQNADIATKALAATTNQQTLAALDKAPPQIEEQPTTTEEKKGFWKTLFSKPNP